MRVSVKGSQDGAWGLLQNYKVGVDYYEAAELWLKSQQSDVVFCLVQFEGVPLGQCPRIYLARASEIAAYLKQSKNGSGYSKLYEDRTYKKGVGLGSRDKIPGEWSFTVKRIEDLLNSIE